MVIGGISIKNKKGFTIVEVLLALIIIGLISVIVTQLLGFNITSSKAFSLYGRQQYTVQDAFSRLNRDIEAASQVIICDEISHPEYRSIQLFAYMPNEGDKQWIGEYKLENGELWYRADDSVANFTSIVKGLTDNSAFIYGYDCLTVLLEPDKTSTGRNALNMNEPITAAYSLLNRKHSLSLPVP
ncbi:MAG: prepilin-type N-terminal cleavage/methylation domain-containing protein [Clostridiaceae bacterium]|nr:prepilin-type N-terminal cleavage/methylation domain-containing protein [Clostridiaceae bacterium]